MCQKKKKKRRDPLAHGGLCAGVFSRFFPEGERHRMHK